MERETVDTKTIVKNIGYLFNGEVISQVLTLLLVIAISRYLGDEGLGMYSFAFSFAALLLIFADFGLATFVTKDVAKNKATTPDHLSKTFTLKIILNSGTVLITTLLIFFSGRDQLVVNLVILAAIAMFFYNFAGVFRSIFEANQLMKFEVTSRIVERALATLLGIYLMRQGWGVLALLLTLVLSNFVYYLVMWFFTSKNVGSVSFNVDKAYWKKILIASLPYWLILIFVNINLKIDTIMLGFMQSYEAVGWYNAAYKFIDMFVRVLFLPIIALFPALAEAHTISHQRTLSIFKKSFYYMLLLAIPTAVGLILVADRVIPFIYGPEFFNSIIALQILGFALFFVSLNFLMGYLLNSVDQQKLFTLTTAISAAGNVVLNFYLIPLYSYIGAAFATVASEIINFALFFYFTRRQRFPVPLFSMLIKPVIAVVIMALAVLLIKSNFHILVVIAVGALVYGIAILVMKGIHKDEMDLVKGLIGRK